MTSGSTAAYWWMIAAALVGGPSGCARHEPAGPPQIRYGRDECAECGMSIVDPACAGAIVARTRDGREYRLFDDIGCMLEAEQEAEVIERHVQDHASRAWTPAGQAWFVVASADRIATPMGSGMIAFALRADAERAAREHDGLVLDWSRLREHRPPARPSGRRESGPIGS